MLGLVDLLNSRWTILKNNLEKNREKSIAIAVKNALNTPRRTAAVLDDEHETTEIGDSNFLDPSPRYPNHLASNPNSHFRNHSPPTSTSALTPDVVQNSCASSVLVMIISAAVTHLNHHVVVVVVVVEWMSRGNVEL